jgi:hypothetical protein
VETSAAADENLGSHTSRVEVQGSGGFSLIIQGRLIGEFPHVEPWLSRYSPFFYCPRCGETFARRISLEARSNHHGIALLCPGCGPHVVASHFDFPTFRLPIERDRGFGPASILAEEFKLALTYYHEDLKNGHENN